MKKISLPNWVYGTLKRYGNVALPTEFNDVDKEELRKHIKEVVGFDVKITLVDINEAELKQMNNKINFKPFLKVEEKR